MVVYRTESLQGIEDEGRWCVQEVLAYALLRHDSELRGALLCTTISISKGRGGKRHELGSSGQKTKAKLNMIRMLHILVLHRDDHCQVSLASSQAALPLPRGKLQEEYTRCGSSELAIEMS